jgi:hypothetical protein
VSPMSPHPEALVREDARAGGGADEEEYPFIGFGGDMAAPVCSLLTLD